MTAVIPILRLGETAAKAYRGDRGKIAYDHSQVTSGNPHGVEWATLLNKPSVFAPSAHTHARSDLTGLAVTDSPAFYGLSLTGPSGTGYGAMDWQTAGMPFPVSWNWGKSDFNEGQIDVNFGWSLNKSRTLNTHPEFSMNYENFFIQPGGQEIIEHNWAYDPKGGGANQHRPYQFHVICGPVGNANLHKSSHEFRNVYSWIIFGDKDGSAVTVGLTDTAADKQFRVNRRISGTVPTTLNQPLFAMETSTAISGNNLLKFTGVLSSTSTSGLELDLTGSVAGVNGLLVRANASVLPLYCETTGAASIRGVFGAGTADASFTFGANGNLVSFGNDYSAATFSISGSATLGTDNLLSIDISSGGNRGQVTMVADVFTSGYFADNGSSYLMKVKNKAGSGYHALDGYANYLYIVPRGGAANGGVIIRDASDTDRFHIVASGSSTFRPSSNDGATLGVSGTAWSDLFLASGGVINFDAGDVTITHASNALTFAGASSGYTFDAGVVLTPASSVTLGTNGHFAVEITSNTAGNLVYRGSDGTTRRFAFTLS